MRSQSWNAVRLCVTIIFVCFIVGKMSAQKFEFNNVDKSELEMKDNPKQPGAHAMILELRDAIFDNTGFHRVYIRTKVFTAEGKKYGDIEIEYKKGNESVNGIKARTIHPDGTVIPFNGQVYDKLIVKDRNNKYHAKTFSMPDVQPGSILEYYYTKNYEFEGRPAIWFFQHDLFIQKATLRLTSYDLNNFGVRVIVQCNAQRTPHNEKPSLKGDQFGLDLTDVPAYEDESFEPPTGADQGWLICWYSDLNLSDPMEKFWKAFGKEKYNKYEEKIGRRKVIEQEASSLIAATDTAEQKVRKLYERVQKIRNLSFEHEKTEQEKKKEKRKDVNNIEEVMKNGYGYATDINLFFVGLVRAAGIEANMVQTSRRNEFFFNKESKMDYLLNDNITMVKIDGKDVFLDPSMMYCPFGFLNWDDTDVDAITLSKDGGEWVKTPVVESKDAQRVREADLDFSEGLLKGKVHVTYKDTRAMTRRLDFLDEDETEQKHDLEAEAKSWFPQGADVKLVKVENTKDASKPLLVDFDVEINGVGSSVGSRVLVPMAIFQSNEISTLRHEDRKHAVYFHTPTSDVDRVNIKVPSDFIVDSVPKRKTEQQLVGVYDAQYALNGNTLIFQRTIALYGIYYPLQYYAPLRTFFDKIALNDQDSAVLKVKQ